MSELQSAPTRFQWKWVWISLLVYFVLYFLPLSLVPGGFLSGTVVTKASTLFIGVWSIAGIIIIAAVVGFLSKDVTIKEPAVAAVGLMVLWIVAVSVKFNIAILCTMNTLPFISVLIIVGLLAVGGAWFGERAQKLWNK